MIEDLRESIASKIYEKHRRISNDPELPSWNSVSYGVNRHEWLSLADEIISEVKSKQRKDNYERSKY